MKLGSNIRITILALTKNAKTPKINFIRGEIHKITNSILKSSWYKGSFNFNRRTTSQKSLDGLTVGVRLLVGRLPDGLLTTLNLLDFPPSTPPSHPLDNNLQALSLKLNSESFRKAAKNHPVLFKLIFMPISFTHMNDQFANMVNNNRSKLLPLEARLAL